MSGGGIIALVGLTFSILAIRLMMVVENAQIVVVGVIGPQLPKKQKALVFAMDAKKFYTLKIAIAFLERISSLIFLLQEMELEKSVRGAASTIMITIIASNKTISNIAAKYAKYAVKKVKKRAAY